MYFAVFKVSVSCNSIGFWLGDQRLSFEVEKAVTNAGKFPFTVMNKKIKPNENI